MLGILIVCMIPPELDVIGMGLLADPVDMDFIRCI